MSSECTHSIAIGNHDIGFGKTLRKHAYNRFEHTFGPPNKVFVIDNTRIAIVDSISLLAEPDTLPHKKAANFVADQMNFTSDPLTPYRVLFTHVPLFRPDGSGCGKRRYNPDLHQGMGYQYQSMSVVHMKI
jgi:ethanolamine phosphate phosphodiesterase